MTALTIESPSWIDRAAVNLGRALTEWGSRHARVHTAPDFAEQNRRVESSRDAAARVLPQLPR
jgi:hypothetical protein